MKKCPFCGADIEESARFCLYCMRSLTEKEQIPPHPKKKPQYLMIIAAFVIPILTLAIIWFSKQSVAEPTHTPAAAVIEKYIDSSCTETGSYDEVIYCSECQEEISRTPKTVAKKSHDYNQKVATTEYLKTEATCTDSAVYYYSCSCGDMGTASFKAGDPLDHTYNQTVVDDKYFKSSADCNNAAVYYYSCVCGAEGSTTFTVGEANGHSYSSAWEKNATHHWHKATCEHITEKSEEAEHNYGTDNVCDTCGYDKTIHVSGITLNFSSLAMTVDDVKTLIATVTPNNATNQNVIWTSSNASIVTVDASGKITAVGVGTATITVTTADGNKNAQCTIVVSAKVCHHTATRTERENEVDSTCKVTGTYDEVIYCTTCGDELSRVKKTIDKKTTHIASEAIQENIVDSTCKDIGSYEEVVYCSVCNCEMSRISKTIDNKPHEYNQKATTTKYLKTDATCTNSAVYYYSCICGEKGSTTFTIGTVVPHSFGEWIVDSVATCMKEGMRHHVCAYCQNSVSETYADPNAHSYDSEWTMNATYHWHTCSKCKSVSDKKAHLIDGNGKCSFCSYQTTPSTDGIIYMISEDGTYAEVIDYTASEKNVVISTVYRGVPVTKIGNYAFEEKNITSVDIPNSVTSIGDCAFMYCRNLASVTIGNSVTSIGGYAFSCCALTDLTIPDSVKSIGMAAFYANANLANVKIGNGVTVIGMHAFMGCQKLISVTLPNGVERIEDGLFSDCFALTSVTLGDNVTYIGNDAFFCCSNLRNITIPDSITTVGSDAFFACYDLTEKVNGVTYVDKIVVDVDNAAIVELREGTRAIAASAFSKCIKLRKVTIPDSVLGIGYDAFAMCENLESVIMSKNLKIIGDRAFYLCKNLSSIVIPASVTRIGHQAFSGCERLTNIKYCGTETQWEAISKELMWDDKTNYTLTYNYTGA